jgi:hypothetical protein
VDDKAKKLADKIKKEVERSAGKGLHAFLLFIEARTKEVLSIPAPRKIVRPVGKPFYYRALTPATKGAPPRKLSGRLRGSVQIQMTSPTSGVIGASARAAPSKNYPGGFPYNIYHEIAKPEWLMGGRHKYIHPTLEKYRKEGAKIVGQAIMFGAA